MAFTRTRTERPPPDGSTYELGRQRLRTFMLALVVLGLIGAVMNWWFGRAPDPRAGSRPVAGPAVRVTSTPTSYRVVYRVDLRGGDKPVVNTETYWVRRPFESRIETHAGPPPGKRRLSVRQSVLGTLTNVSPRAAPLNVAAPPSIASGDVRIDAVLDEAVRDKVIEQRERRAVFGRPCQVYRTGGPVSAGDITPYVRGADEFADVCVDREGIVLEEAWTLHGSIVRTREAVEVRTDVPIDESLLRIAVPAKPSVDRGDVSKMSPEAAKQDPGWHFDPPPKGFDFLGRFAVLFPRSAQATNSPLPPPPATSATDVYVRGPDLLVVDQDPSLVSLVKADQRPTRKLRIEGFKQADLIVDARSSEIRATDEEGTIVRIFGTLAPSRLVAAARTLVNTPG